jgi:hypothetical protein
MSQPQIQRFGTVEVCQTQYNHPSITSGQHTNGPASIWVRVPGGEWVLVPRCSFRSLHEIREWCWGLGAEFVDLCRAETPPVDNPE